MMAVLGLGEPRPTAVFAHNDLMAVGALEEIAERGLRCPEDVSIVGFNDSPLTGHLSPSLSTVRLASEEMGRIAGQMASAAVDAPGTRVLRMDVYLPTSELYMTSWRGVSSDPSAPASVAHPEMTIPEPLPVDKVTPQAGLDVVYMAIPVAGTNITQFGLSGSYKVEVRVEGQAEPFATSNFEIVLP